MTQPCEEVRMALGAHVLGTLDAAEGERVTAHVEGCAGCRAELRAIAELPAVLGRLSADEVAGTPRASPPDPAEGPAGLLERTLAEMRRRRRRARLRLRIALATAGLAVLAAGGGALGIALDSRAGPLAGAAARLSATDTATGVAASADVYAESWGSTIRLWISGVTPGQSCELVTVAPDGSEEIAGTWSVGYTGAVEVSGATGLTPDRIAALRVVTTGGSVLVSLPGARTAGG